MHDNQLLLRVILKNYKSIAACDVTLPNLAFLVGKNGSGKSNFLDALRFTRDALRNSLDNALRERGGLGEVRRRSGGHPTHFGIRLELRLPSGDLAKYVFEIGARTGGTYSVQRELCVINSKSTTFSFDVRSGEVVYQHPSTMPTATADRLYLVNASGIKEFRELYDCLVHMGFYNLNPRVIRDLQPPGDDSVLKLEGENLASVLARLKKSNPRAIEDIEEYLNKVSPNVHSVEPIAVGPKETIQFRQDVAGQSAPWKFYAANMSDGTLRALGILTALFQSDTTTKTPLVAIEEPEVALHPAAASVIREALRFASRSRQIIVTSHSPELLDDPNIGYEQILAVSGESNVTRIGPLDEGAKSALRQSLFTAGELLRLDQLEISKDYLFHQAARQLDLFSA